MRFTEELLSSPSDSKVEVFQKFVGSLILLQKQLDPAITAIDFSETGQWQLWIYQQSE